MGTCELCQHQTYPSGDGKQGAEENAFKVLDGIDLSVCLSICLKHNKKVLTQGPLVERESEVGFGAGHHHHNTASAQLRAAMAQPRSQI